ncbi:MAG TPA: TlpA disulfide reductase family protein [Pseudonocardiaceae bacterium]|jgi:thiol-disulfide isomerase/thioredoxin|nr:TlpA disulfide reductase family protein [Pseudonocardiaceae bacterium]
MNPRLRLFRGRGRSLAVLALACLSGVGVLAGCTSTHDAVDQSGFYAFVSPGGKTQFFYPVAQRKPLAPLSGDSLTQPGKLIQVADFTNQVVVINLWGSWCGPCRSEAPDLAQAYNQTKKLGVEFLGLDERDVRSAAADFVHNNQIGYPSIFDDGGRGMLALNGFPREAVPSTLILDRQHRVAAVYIGQVYAGTLLPMIQQIAAESARTPG